MTDRVNANIADVRKLAAALDRYQKEVGQAAATFQAALSAADWHDPQKTRFEQKFADIRRATDRFVGTDVAEMKKALLRLAGQLEQIRQIRL